MLTEPKTSPKSFALQTAYALIVAFFMIPQLSIFTLNSSPELALMLGNVFAFIVSPKGRHVLTLRERHDIGPGIYSFAFALPPGFSHEPGQYADFALPLRASDGRGSRRAFSIASSPTEREVLIAARFPDRPSHYKTHLAAMKPGDSIIATEVSGEFVLPRNKRDKLAFIAGGVGITPFRSMIKYLADRGEPRDTALLYSARHEGDLAFRDVFWEAGKKVGLKATYTLTGRDKVPESWSGERGRIDAAMIRRTIPDYRQRSYFVSGSPDFVEHVRRELHSIGVPRTKVRADPFEGY